jgi:predicted nucleic acid-binding protein
LAESLPAEFWTADQRLYKALARIEVSWAHWVGEADQDQQE